MMKAFANQIGSRIFEYFEYLGGVAILTWQSLRSLYKRHIPIELTVEQMYFIGVRSMSIVAVTAGSCGMVMALQFGLGMAKFGAKLYVPKLVSLSVAREIGPVFCSIMLAGRVGAGLASEIASMVVTQQIDAMRALGTSPIHKVVVPRLIACMIVIPLLATLGIFLGTLGAGLVGVHELGLDPSFYYQKVISTVQIKDYVTGIGKTVFFAFFIATSACYFGLTTPRGTEAVGIATTKSVVTSSILIFVSNYFLTKLFFMLFGA